MESQFHQNNRGRLYASLEEGTLALLFSGRPVRKTQDENYPFYADRNFVYLTGIEQEECILAVEKDGGEIRETLFLLPPDAHAERWSGRRMRPEEANRLSGVEQFQYVSEFPAYLHRCMKSGHFHTAAMDFYKFDQEDRDSESFRLARKLRRDRTISASTITTIGGRFTTGIWCWRT